MKKICFFRCYNRVLKGPCLSFFVWSFFLIFSTVLFAEEKSYDMDQFVEAFLKNNDIVKAYREQITVAESDVDRANAQYFPKTKFYAGFGPFPGYSNYDVNSGWQKNYEWDQWGLAIRGKLSGEMPLYTFGMISSMSDAAKHGVKVSEAESDIAEKKLKKEAVSIYYRYLFAVEMKSIMDDVLKQLNEAEELLQQMIYDEKEGVSQKDLSKLRIEKEKLLYQYDEIIYGIDSAKYAFSIFLGDDWAIKDASLLQRDFSESYDSLEDFFITKSVYAKYAENGVKAKRSLYDYNINSFFPVIGISGYLEFNYTSSVDDADYPGTSPYNNVDGEIGVGLMFNMNVLEKIAQMKKAKAEWRATEMKVRFAKKSAVVELKKKYNDLTSAESKIKHLKKAKRLSKGIMTVEMLNYKSNVGDVKDLVSSIKDFVSNEYLLLEANYDYNMMVEDILLFVGK